MEDVKNQQVKLDDYSSKRLNDIVVFYGLTVGTFFLTDPFKVVCSILSSLQMRALHLNEPYASYIHVDISFLKGLLYDLSR